jgi:hypothetical protein
MAKITNIVQMRDYIKTRLGWPVINVEVADIQFDQIIEDSAQDFNFLNYGEAAQIDYMLFSTSANVAEYSFSGQNIAEIYDISISLPQDGINTMFTPTHMLLYEQFMTQGGSMPGANNRMGGQSDSGIVLGGYDIAMMYLKEIKQHFGKMYSVRWNPNTESLRIFPTPTEAGTGLLYMYRKEWPENLYNHPLMKKLCVARGKMQWGIHLKKYNVTLPDGMGITGTEMYSDGMAEEEKILDDIRLMSAPVDFFIG